MNKTILLGAAAALALLAGCKSETSTTTNTVIANEAANVTAPAPATANVTAEVSPAVPALNLAPDELTLVLPDGAARHATFGLDKATVTTMVSSALGSPIEQSTAEDCGAGKLDYASFREGLSLYFQDGKFAGWDLDGRENGKFQTANGIGIGSTRKQIEDAGSALEMQPDSTIGNEFMIGDMSGLLSATTPAGKVTNLWAGVTCIAR